MKPEKYIRDPIHGLIAFDRRKRTDRLAWALIQTDAFQRLRHIRQLGFADLVFPAATHTRFSHSIGVFHLARRLWRILQPTMHDDDEMASATMLAALLHDLGHGPFSHAFEKVTGIAHEEMTLRIIQEDEGIAKILGKENLSDPIAKIFQKTAPPMTHAIVSSQFDADRLDYMQRDRYMTGMGGSGFDLEWLLRCLEADPDKGGFCLNHKGIHHAEEYLLARHHLYIHVYMHHGARGAEILLHQFLNGLREGGLEETHPLAKALLREAAPHLKNYLALNDSLILEVMHRMRGSKSAAGKAAAALLSRRLPRFFDVSSEARAHGEDEKKAREKIARFKKEMEPRMSETLVCDERTISAYLYRREGMETEKEGPIWIRALGETTPRKLEDLSDIVKRIPEHHIFRLHSTREDEIEAARQIWRKLS